MSYGTTLIKLSARDQFLAIAVGVWGHNNCTHHQLSAEEALSGHSHNDNSNSNNASLPVTLLSGVLMSQIGRDWIVGTAKRFVVRLSYYGGKNEHSEYFLVGVSHTLGVTDGPREVLYEMGEKDPLVFLSDKVVMKRVGFGRMQANRLQDCREMVEKKPIQSKHWMNCSHRSVRSNCKWAVGVDYSGTMTVWKLQQDHFPSDSLKVYLPRQPRGIWHGLTEITWSKRSMISQGDELCIVTRSTTVKSNWEVRIVDLKRTLDTGALSVVELHTIVRDENVVSEPVAVMSSCSDGSLFLPFRCVHRIELVNVITSSIVIIPNTEKFHIVDSSHFAVGHQIFEVSNTQSPVRMDVTIPVIPCSDMFHQGLICTHTCSETISFHDALCGQFLFSIPDDSPVATVQVQTLNGSN
ncbi:hypothetical protein Pelo_18056 [Pelomyxa schiedti]|nr:hypothetical protein Pelo_18056 [Pelomyxa schiedti]